MKNSPLRVAIVGCGRIGRHHCQSVLRDGRAQITALYDLDHDAAKRLRDELQLTATLVSSFEQLLASSAVDAVILCSPTSLHFDQAKRCLQRGWHLLCEKPLAITRGEILELIDMSESATARGQIFSIGYQRRYWSTYRTLQQAIKSGRWGAVRAVSAHLVEPWQRTVTGTWRDDPQQNPGGFVGDAGSHKIDILFYLTDLAPREVFARTWQWGSSVEIIASISAVLEGEVACTFDFVGNAQYLGEDFSIHCEQADLLLRHGSLWIGRGGELQPLPTSHPDGDPVTALVDAIEGRATNQAPASCALPVFDFTQAMRESAASRQNVVITREDCR